MGQGGGDTGPNTGRTPVMGQGGGDTGLNTGRTPVQAALEVQCFIDVSV